MRISLSATNPCHVWDMARALAATGDLGCYYSGYPRWRLRGGEGLPVRSFSARTLVVYGARRLLPEALRPRDRRLFRWQDWAFDRRVARALEEADFVHGLPGQCLETFRRARELGLRTVLSHATGPVRELERLVAPEYARAGLEFARETQYDEVYFERERAEYALADYHWASSSVVAEQLRAVGVPGERIWVVPYGVDPGIFGPGEERGKDGTFRLVLAGQLSLRKGFRHLLDALAMLGDSSVELHHYGHRMAEVEPDIAAYGGASPLHFHGPVSQGELCGAFQKADLLVLPSLEEGFGLVVIQALACGLPCLVSDRVGAQDALAPGETGLIAPVGDRAVWVKALLQARESPWDRASIAAAAPRWEAAARILLAKSREALGI